VITIAEPFSVERRKVMRMLGGVVLGRLTLRPPLGSRRLRGYLSD
jgi:hypothetical protein